MRKNGYLTKLHQAVLDKYKGLSEMQRGSAQEARELQSALNYLYQTSLGFTLDRITGEVNLDVPVLSEYFTNNYNIKELFDYSDPKLSATAAGFQFEENFTLLLNKGLNISAKNIGGNKTISKFTEVNIGKKANRTFEDEMVVWTDTVTDGIIKTTIGELRKKIKPKTSVKIATSSVPGKTDVQITNNVNNKLLSAFQGLSNSRLSLKNYADITTIKIDDSSTTRAIFNVVSSLNDPYFKVNTVLRILKPAQKKDGERYEHKQHIKFIYGLSGMGQYSAVYKRNQESVDMIDYLIVFHKTNQINPFYVLYVPDIIEKQFSNQFGFGNTINLNNFLTN